MCAWQGVRDDSFLESFAYVLNGSSNTDARVDKKLYIETKECVMVKTHDTVHFPVDTGRKLNVPKTFRRRPGLM